MDSIDGIESEEQAAEESPPEGSLPGESTHSPSEPEIFDELAAVRMSGAGVRREHARARIAEALFGETVAPPDPVKLDRFVILDKLGRGGMGVVYSAYDPELDRHVALKLLQSSRQGGDPDARARLLREAQAQARLSHPNVVPVHDVGVIDEQVFIVMELVAGRDLRAWRDEAQPDWRAILAVYMQAGRGLAAAHQAGLVHRDFKPENALVGEDGRVRVLDFGLARGGRPYQTPPRDKDASGAHGRLDGERAGRAIELGLADTQRPASPSGPGASGSGSRDTGGALLDVAMTETGTILGTPAYMSPEQFAGQDVGQASDQFSFCVSLFEALFGERPFTGTTLAELGAALSAGEIREPAHGDVPGRFLPILRRGMATRSEERYPSMDELLDALAYDPVLVRRRWLLAAGALALVMVSAGVAYALSRGPGAPAVDPCGGAREAVAEVWNPTERAAVTEAILATGHPYAPRAAALVGDKLDAYAGAWAEMRRDACTAHQHGQQSGALLDRRMGCLEQRRHALQDAVSVLRAAGAGAVENTVLVVQELPPVEYCADVAALSAEVPPPEDPAVARRVEELVRVLSRAKAEEDAGGYERALALADEVSREAHALGYQPLVARAELARGRVMMAQGDYPGSIEPFDRAVRIGLRAGVDKVALEALARRMYVEGTSAQDSGAALAELDVGLALAERLPDGAFVNALMLNNAGVVSNARGDPEAARALWEQAFAVKQGMQGRTPLELVNITKNLAMVTADPGRRIELVRAARQEVTRALGPDHPQTLIVTLAESDHTRDLAAAHELRRDVCERLLRYHAGLVTEITDCLYYDALSLAELGQSEKAAAASTRLIEFLAERDEPESARHRELARGYRAYYQGQYDEARAAFERVLALMPDLDRLPWWQRSAGLDALLGLGMSEHALGHPRAAVLALEQAQPGFEELSSRLLRYQIEHRLAHARASLARALRASAAELEVRGERAAAEDARARASRLADLARAWYRADPATREWRLPE